MRRPMMITDKPRKRLSPKQLASASPGANRMMIQIVLTAVFATAAKKKPMLATPLQALTPHHINDTAKKISPAA
jgi:hypothetical protein